MSESTSRTAPPGHVESPQRIDVSVERVRILADQWATRWNRPPTNEELAGMIRRWVGEEILYREAIGRGLDQHDELVRRRLVQKMYGIARGLAQLAEPAEAEMRAFYLDKLDRYVVPARRSFRQVYVSTEQGHDVAELRAAELLEVLPQASPDAATGLGDPFVLASEFSLLTAQEVAARFGPLFAESLFDLVPGVWEGPIPSSFGLHLVQVSVIAEDHVPSFEEARDRVHQDVNDQRTRAAEAGLVAALASEYLIDYTWDDSDLELSDLSNVTRVPNLDLLGTLAVLVPKKSGGQETPRQLPLDGAGNPDWARLMAELHLTGSHGDIALAGGAPRRTTLIEPGQRADPNDPRLALLSAEFARGLRVTAGATIVDAAPGWVGFTCDNSDMAVWMIRALAAENITVRREGTTVLLPVSASFTLEGEILDMVLATAQVHHFFEDHIRVDDHEHE